MPARPPGQHVGVGHEHACHVSAGRRLSAEHAGAGVTGGDLRIVLAPLACPTPHGAIPAGKAEVDEFAPQQGSVAAAIRPAPFKVVAAGCKNTHPRRFAPERGTASLEPAPDRLALGAKLGGNAQNRTTGRAQPCGFFVARLPAGIGGLAAPDSRGRLGTVRRWRDHGRHRQLCAELPGSTPDHSILAIDNRTNRVTEVSQQMPTIRDLHCARSALAPRRRRRRPGRERRSRLRDAGEASRQRFRPAGQAGGRQPCCALGRPEWSRIGDPAAKPSRQQQGRAEWAVARCHC